MDNSLRGQFINAMLRMKGITQAVAQERELHMSEFIILDKITGNSQNQDKMVYVSDIQQYLHISKPSISQALNSLERKGYISRKINAGDRRRIEIFLTSKGLEAKNKMKVVTENRINEILTRLGDENTRQLIDSFNRLMDVLEKIKIEKLCELDKRS
ncbi:MAG: MarR family transcriptional regulator [Clostridiales bacterium]|jgi:DNA-binding MarR family transcriptional regulator|nr:MarR family transcriptional regulator [Clostridiales bacterium]